MLPLGRAPRGFRGRIQAVQAETQQGWPAGGRNWRRRLIELGFVEGATVELLHEGLFGRDPIAVRVDHTTIALRRREAMAILVTPDAPA